MVTEFLQMVLSHPSIHPTVKNCCCYNHPLNLWSNTLHWHCTLSFYLIKNESIDLTSYKEHCDIYTKIHCSIAVNSCQIERTQKDIILLSEVFIVIYKAGKHTDVENTNFIHFNLSAGTYSIDDFNVKIKVAILQQRQGWEPPQIKDLKLVIPEDYTFIACNDIFIALGIQVNYLENTMLIRSRLPPGSYKTSLDIPPPPI